MKKSVLFLILVAVFSTKATSQVSNLVSTSKNTYQTNKVKIVRKPMVYINNYETVAVSEASYQKSIFEIMQQDISITEYVEIDYMPLYLAMSIEDVIKQNLQIIDSNDVENKVYPIDFEYVYRRTNDNEIKAL